MPRSLPLVLLALLLGPAAALADETPPEAAVPAGLPIQLDGVLSPSEWGDAAALELGESAGTLRIKQHRGTLLLAFETPDAWLEGDELILSTAPIAPEKDIGMWTDGAVSIRYEPIKHDRDHLILNRMEGAAVVPFRDQVVARTKRTRRSSRTEMAIPLRELGVDATNPEPLRLIVIRSRLGGGSPIPTWPAGLDIGARAGQHPRDMRSSARWGRITGLKDAGAPGAFSKTDWTRMLKEQAEIANRGRQAHVLMFEMETEKRSFKKQESLVDEQIFGNLEWIRQREPLGDVDLMLMAKAHRLMNRNAEALALLDALAGSSNVSVANRARYQRTFALRNLGRHADEAAAWEELIKLAKARQMRSQYEVAARRARQAQEVADAQKDPLAADAKRGDLPIVELLTSRGRILIRMLPHDTPKATAHFLKLVEDGYYDGLHWHRVLLEYVAQCGDPITKGGDCSLAGSGDSDRKVDVEENKRLKPGRGAVCFARKKGLYSNGGQFFILTTPQYDLADDSKVPYTLFGWVESGMDVVDRLDWCDPLIRARVLYAPPAPKDDSKDKGGK